MAQAPAEDNLLFRIDYSFGNNHSLFGSYVFDEGGRGGFFTGSFPSVGFRQGYRRDQNVAVSDIYLFTPRLTNEFNLGWARDHNLIIGSTFGPDVLKTIGLQGVKPLPIPAIPTMNIAGFTTVTQQSFQQIPEDIYSVSNNLSWITGRHRLKTGVLFTHGRATQVPFGVDNFYGNFGFQNNFATGYSFADFLLGIPRTAFRLNADFFDKVTWKRNTWQLFVQDDMDVTRKLTLNLGLRYEYHQPFRDKRGRQYTFDPQKRALVVLDQKSLALVDPGVRTAFTVLTAEQAGYPERLVETDGNNFAPRLGFAYRPFNRTVIRGGYGIFYDFNPPLQGNIAPFVPSESFPNNQIVSGVPLYQFPNPFPAAALPVGTLTLAASTRKVIVPYSQQWNLTVENQVFQQTALRASYIGTRGVQQVWNREINIPAPSTTPFTQSRRPFPQFGPIALQENGSGHLYQALQLRVEHRDQRGLFVASHWTLAKDVGSNQGQREDSVLNPFNREADRGNTFHIPRHQWISEFNWRVPIGHGRAFGATLPATLNYVVGGWQLTGIFNVGSGNWLTPSYSGYDATGTGILGGRPDRIGDGNLPKDRRSASRWFDASAFTIPGASTGAPLTPPPGPIGRFGNSGVGIIEGPGYWQFDTGLNKGFPLAGERLQFNIFILATNVFNHPNLADPNLSITTPLQVGLISGIRGDGNASGIGMRLIQLGARVEF
ncbi:MAG TPA: TonB-dependent receptor [Acidobacteriota bacterium]